MLRNLIVSDQRKLNSVRLFPFPWEADSADLGAAHEARDLLSQLAESLTPSETAAFDLWAAGSSREEIARNLGIELKTASNLKSQIRSKLRIISGVALEAMKE
jgi:DNA-binding CsgD family transcriptional regulator